MPNNILDRLDSYASFLSTGSVTSLDPAKLSEIRSFIPRLLSIIPSQSIGKLRDFRSQIASRLATSPSEYSYCGVFLYLVDLLFDGSIVPTIDDCFNHSNILGSGFCAVDEFSTYTNILFDPSFYSSLTGATLNNYLLSGDLQSDPPASLKPLAAYLRSQLISYSVMSPPLLGLYPVSSFSSFTSYSAIMGDGDKLSLHLHPNSVCTSTFYPFVDSDVQGSELRMYLPNALGQLVLAKTIKPKTGDLFSFPGWIYHDTSPKISGGRRICINSDAYSFLASS